MNRINTILICLTSIAIFFILKQQRKGIDLIPYLEQIEALEKKVDSLHSQNTALQKEADSLELQMEEYDKKINSLNYTLYVIKKETQAKLDSIDKFGDDELERFFAERYHIVDDTVN